MKLSFLPSNYISALKNFDIELLYELRLRTSYPVKINYSNQNYYLYDAGLTNKKTDAIICQQKDIDYVIKQITEHSIYAFNDRLKEGFITTNSGVRVGIAGECVFNDEKIKTIKNISSLNIRVPHIISGCSSKIMPYIYCGNKINNTLIISPPFLGKTTLLKDIIINLNKLDFGAILVIDERGEFCEIKGENIDNILYSNKNYAFNYAVRSMSPQIIITDELSMQDDWECAKNAVNSGIKIIASCHSDDIENLKQKKFFVKNLFERYVVLYNNRLFGQVKYIYDKEFKKICDCS